MQNIILIPQMIVGAILIVLVLLQQRGSSLGSAFGGGGEFYVARRGMEKKMFWATIVVGMAFIGLALLNLVL